MKTNSITRYHSHNEKDILYQIHVVQGTYSLVNIRYCHSRSSTYLEKGKNNELMEIRTIAESAKVLYKSLVLCLVRSLQVT